MKLITIGIILLLLSGCAARWDHATKRRSDFYADDRECQAVTGGASRIVEPGRERISYEGCMWDLGWHKKTSIWFFDPVEN